MERMVSSKVLEAFSKCGSVSTDTRNIKPGDIFFALSGGNFDGNKFAAKALELGASYAVVSDKSCIPPGDDRFIWVEDTLRELQLLALSYRRQFRIPVIGITGTNGKTTSKELIHAVLSTVKKVHATVGNLNNHIGVPLTLLSMPADTEIAIIEMGANKHGDIKELVEIAEPTHGIITNIGRAHLERFGDIEGVEQTKGEMFDFARAHGGIGIVNVRDERVRRRADGVVKQITYGAKDTDYFISDLRMEADHLDVEVTFAKVGEAHWFRSNLIGAHNAENVLLAVAVGDVFGVPVPEIRRGLEGYFPRLNRTELIRGAQFNVLLDAYNANPSSMEATLRSVHAQGFKPVTFVLGDMFELGPDSHAFHLDLVRMTQELFPEGRLVGVGKEMVAAVKDVGYGVAFERVEDAGPFLSDLVKGSDWVVVKGSRGMALERLLPSMGIEREASSTPH